MVRPGCMAPAFFYFDLAILGMRPAAAAREPEKPLPAEGFPPELTRPELAPPELTPAE